MKILCLSFLRLGDIYMQAHIIRQMQAEYPDSEIDVVCFEEFKEAHHAFTEVNQWYYISRTAIQNSLIKNEQSIWNSFKILRNIATLLKVNQYDMVCDLSHTQFSYLFFCLLKPITEYRKQHRDVYLENDFKTVNTEQKHWVEAFKATLGLKNELKVTQKVFSSVNALDFSGEIGATKSVEPKKVLLQLNTSDTKKNWNKTESAKLIAELNSFFGEDNVDVLASPFEVDHYSDFVQEKQIKVLSLPQVQAGLRNYDLVVTLDTSISHLAALKSNVPILLISLGSSRSIKTGPYREDTFVLEPTVSCYPCNHASQCSQMTHRCSKAVEATDVLRSIKYILTQDSRSLSLLVQNENVRFIKQEVERKTEAFI